ncbi:MAG: hypothetical protein KF809_03455 [Chloroflexi bacterium]|nr:hypothetical protein [Chloroflexota bacterium]
MRRLASVIRPVIVGALALSLLVPAAVLAQDPSAGDPDKPVAAPVEPILVLEDDDAVAVVPEDGLLDIRDQGWEQITVGPDGRTLKVYFWSGVEACYGLAGVTVDETGEVPVIQLQVGRRPGVEVCIEMAQLFSTTVALETPLVGGSSSEGLD